MKTKVTDKDRSIARDLFEMAGPKAPGLNRGGFYVARMARVVARIRAAERSATIRKLRRAEPYINPFVGVETKRP